MRTLLPLALLLLSACPDPSQNKDKVGPQPGMGPVPGEMPGGMPGGVPGGAPGEVAPTAGMPPGAVPGAGPGVAGGAPPVQGMRPNAKFTVSGGAGVKISGSVAYTGTKTGTIRVDFLRTTGSQFPELVNTLTLDKLGAFETEAPKDFGPVSIMAFIDSSDDGPTVGEPAGAWEPPVDIKSAPITGIDIVLADRPELGALAPPMGKKAPPGGEAPPDGAAPPPPAGGAAPAVNPAGDPTTTGGK